MGRIRVDLTGIISGNESYYVKVDEGFVIDDVTSTPNQAITNTTDIAFTTDPAPLLSASYPADNDTSYTFAQPALVTITFPQDVTINAGNIYIKNGATTVETLNVTNGWMETTTELRIEGSATLDPDIAYTVDYQAGIVKDGNGFSVPAGTDDGTVTVTAHPVVNASKLSLLYPETVTLNTGTITIRKDSDDSLVESFNVPGDVTLVGGNTIEITPSDNWIDDTIDYYATADAGIVLDSNSFESPAITKNAYGLVTPTWTYSGFTGTVRLDFDMDVYAGTGYIYIKRASDDSIIETYNVASDVTFDRNTVTMAATLYVGQSYYINVDATAIESGIEEPYAGIGDTTTLNFTVYNDVPVLLSSTPADNDTGVTSNILTLVFDQLVDIGSGNVYLKKTSDNSILDTIDISTATGGGTDTIVVTLNNNYLIDSTECYILIDSGAIVADDTHVAYPGISSTTELSFTTGNVVHITNMEGIDRNFNENQGNDIFSSDTPSIVGNDTDTYTIEFSTTIGEFTTDYTDNSANWSYTGTRAQCNSKISSMIFLPTIDTYANGTFTYTQKIGSFVTEQITVNLIGSASSPQTTIVTVSTSDSSYSAPGDLVYYASTIDLVLVGGGGGGSNNGNGGGGGGGGGEYISAALSSSDFSSPLNITIGAGGAGFVGGGSGSGTTGNDTVVITSLTTYTAKGGYGSPTSGSGSLGCSGGYSGNATYAGGTGVGPDGNNKTAGGGGGGAGGVGGNAITSKGGNGGAAVNIAWDGTNYGGGGYGGYNSTSSSNWGSSTAGPGAGGHGATAYGTGDGTAGQVKIRFVVN